MEHNESFRFTYSAAEQKEIERIRSKYHSPSVPEDKMTQLRRLDQSVGQAATAASLAVGIIGALVLGAGMSACMVGEQYLLGIPTGLLGIGLVSLAYPVYKWVTRRKRKKLAPQILALSDELLK